MLKICENFHSHSYIKYDCYYTDFHEPQKLLRGIRQISIQNITKISQEMWKVQVKIHL